MNSNISTGSTIKVNEASLSRLPENVRIPKYDRHQISNGIVHIGVGGFHRSHQALYLDDYFHQNPGSDWGICSLAIEERLSAPPRHSNSIIHLSCDF